jgi:hypothetical protein
MITYTQALSLGFKVNHVYDNVHFDEYGYEFKLVQYNLDDTHTLDWDIVTRKVTLITHHGWGMVSGRKTIRGYEQIKRIINNYTNGTNRN